MRLVLSITTILLTIFVCSVSYADGCSNLDGNVRWNQLFQELSSQILNNENDEAFETARKLSEICDESPILNYAIARIYRNTGNNARELYYLQRATSFTEKFAVNPDTMEVLWYERYEAEHPEVRKSESSQKTIEDLNKAVLEAQKQKYETQISTERQNYAQADVYKTMMWSGVAVAGVGLAMTTAGAVLVVLNQDNAVNINHSANQTSVEPIWGVSWALIGAGIAATVAGAAVTGYAGYHYTHRQSENNQLSVRFSPNSFMLTYNF